MNSHSSFREQLLAAGKTGDDQTARLQQEIQAMLTKELTRPRKLFYAVVLTASLGMAGLFSALLATEPTVPPTARIAFVMGLLFSMGWIVHLGRILWTGKLNIKSDARTTANMVWVFTVSMAVLFTFAGMSTLGNGDELKGLMIIAQGLMFLIAAGVYFLGQRIEEAELSTAERLLRLQLQLSEREEETP